MGDVRVGGDLPGHPEEVAPPGAVVRRMRIAGLIAVSVMLAMVGDPIDDRAFTGQPANEADQPADRLIGGEAVVRQIAMKAEADADAAGEPVERKYQDDRL